jgi:hypothetical protein
MNDSQLHGSHEEKENSKNEDWESRQAAQFFF